MPLLNPIFAWGGFQRFLKLRSYFPSFISIMIPTVASYIKSFGDGSDENRQYPRGSLSRESRNAPDSKSEGGISIYLILGILVGLVILMIVFCYCVRRHRENSEKIAERSPQFVNTNMNVQSETLANQTQAELEHHSEISDGVSELKEENIKRAREIVYTM